MKKRKLVFSDAAIADILEQADRTPTSQDGDWLSAGRRQSQQPWRL